MNGTRFFTGLLAPFTLWVSMGCNGDDPALSVASVHPRAAWVLEGGSPRIGEVVHLDAVITAPPGFLPAPLAVPEDVPGFENRGSESPSTSKEPGRWIHRTRLRIRALDVGSFVWPAAQIEIESTLGERTLLTLEPLAIDVRSVMAEHPGRDTPYGVIETPGSAESGDFLRGVAVGGGCVLALVGLVWLVRWQRRPALPSNPADPSDAPANAPWVEARNALARARSETDPVRATHMAAEALSLYAARRFGADTHARTTDELATTMPPLRATSRWPILVSILRDLDGQRFRPAAGGDVAGAPTAILLTRVEAFVDDTTPSEGVSE